MSDICAKLASALAPRAGSFIVTVYGDVVGTRGGALWTGSLIALCHAVGISETLVRTALSRLVAAGRLEGARVGRKSYYRLTASAEAEFAAAARRIYGQGADDPEGWVFLAGPAAPLRERPEIAALTPTLCVASKAGTADLPPAAATGLFSARFEGSPEGLRRFAAETWPEAIAAADYRAYLRVAEPLTGEAMAALDGMEPLAARLLLVHAYRRAALRDPRLPRAALPPEWPGFAAKARFAQAYLALSPAAEQAAAERLMGPDGPLGPPGAEAEARAEGLRRVLEDITKNHSERVDL